MEQLEFALVPIGIVLGYGLTKVLGSWAHIIRAWRQLERPPILFFSATALSMLFMYMNFSGLWAYRGVDFHGVAGNFNVRILILITLPMLLFMLAVSVLVPPNIDNIQDLEGHYAGSTRSFYIVIFGALVTSYLPDTLPGVVRVDAPLLLTILVWAILLSLLALAWVKSRAIHLSVHAFTWSLVMAMFILQPLRA